MRPDLRFSWTVIPAEIKGFVFADRGTDFCAWGIFAAGEQFGVDVAEIRIIDIHCFVVMTQRVRHLDHNIIFQ